MNYDVIFKEASFKLGMLPQNWNDSETVIARSKEKSFIADLVYEVKNISIGDVVRVPVASSTLKDYYSRYMRVAQ